MPSNTKAGNRFTGEIEFESMNQNRAYEIEVAEYFQKKGYQLDITPEQNDWGIDAIALKGQEKIAIQAKNYVNTTRKISRRALFELNGAMKYFDCSQCAIVTNGMQLETANKVAKKLNIEVIYLDNKNNSITTPNFIESKERKPLLKESNVLFTQIWNKQIKAFEGVVLTGVTGLINEIIKVDGGGLTRITKNGKQNFIPIEAFQWAINRIKVNGFVERDEINQEFPGRLSSGVILVLSNLSMFEVQTSPTLKVVSK